MVSAERLLWTVCFVAPLVAVAVWLTPAQPYALSLAGIGTFLGAFPAAYLLAGTRTR